MPQLSPGQPIRAIPASVVLDGSGNGTVFFQATGSAARITNLFGKVSTTTNQATVTVYVGTIADTNAVFNSNSGSTGFTATGQIDIPDGTILYVVWTGGDAGATAKATFSGVAIPFDQISGGFSMRADDPIAAGDGSLIFPAIKSPNYQSGVSGWKIDRTGVAEFLNAIIRGSIDVASGVVRINAAGIFVEDATHLFIINTTGGIQAVQKPADGAYVAMQDQAVYFQPTTPYNGFNTTYASMFVDKLISGSDTYVYLDIRAPGINGQQRPVIRLWGYSDDGTRGGFLDLGANGTTISNIRISNETDIVNITGSGDRYGRGKIGCFAEDTSNSVGVNATETALLTSNSVTFAANRAYKLVMSTRFQNGTGVIHNPQIRIRKTNTAGQTLGDLSRLEFVTTSTQTFYRYIEGIFITSSAVTAAIAFTLQSVAGGTGVIQGGSAGAPRRFDIIDIGPASDYSNYTTLV